MAVRRKSSSNPDHRRNYGLFRELLLQLSNSLTANELEELKFLCGDVLPRGRLDNIKQGFELFQALEHLNKLSLEKRDFLASKLSALDRVDLSNKLLGTEGEEGQPFSNFNDLQRALPPGKPITPATGGVAVPVTSSRQESLHDAPSSPSTRQSIAEQRTAGELDAKDSGQDAVTGAQVDAVLKRQLQFEGCFLNPEKYDPVKPLGRGGQAKVFLVTEKETGKGMACKMYDLATTFQDTDQLVKTLETEVSALSCVKHKHIVEFFRVEEIKKTVLLFLEYMEGGTIMDFVKQEGPLQESVVKHFTWQLLSAVDYLHTNETKKVIHKDIKGGNILLDGPRTNIKLADFGISTIMEQLRTATGGFRTSNNIASFYWTSPELLGEKEFGRNTDIWSVGCTVIEMLTTKPPLFFEDLTIEQKRFRIVQCRVDPPSGCTPGARGFLQRCLRPRSERPSAAELLTDPFVVDQQQ